MKKQPTYKLRKLTIGVCSVALMSLFAAQQQVLADTTDGAQAAETQTVTDSSKNLSAVNQELGETTGHSAQYIQNAVDQAQTKYGVTITTKDNGDNTTSFNTYAKDAQGQDVQGTQLTVSVAKDFTTQAKTVEQGATLNAADLVDNSGDFNNFTVTGFDPETVGEQEVTVTGSVRAYPEDKVSHTATVTVTAASSKDDGTSTDGTDTDTTGTDDDKTPSTPETPATPAYDPQKDLDAVNSALVDMAGRTKDAVDAKIADLQKQYPNTQVNANYLADENKYQF
ncbi:MAG: YSIRK-type signal peptide-containing protein, partial [Limosilactobacillus sp.]|uniref:YSIRK-type signal peptide-containing protein n=1 Tax=Limosilactobacillus sp. TaxID=2773925 RepID=UPI0026FD06ED|nr:YSIRK-type signal peptide-containing protein [Limosilactobacillus sp.]